MIIWKHKPLADVIVYDVFNYQVLHTLCSAPDEPVSAHHIHQDPSLSLLLLCFFNVKQWYVSEANRNVMQLNLTTVFLSMRPFFCKVIKHI